MESEVFRSQARIGRVCAGVVDSQIAIGCVIHLANKMKASKKRVWPLGFTAGWNNHRNLLSRYIGRDVHAALVGCVASIGLRKGQPDNRPGDRDRANARRHYAAKHSTEFAKICMVGPRNVFVVAVVLSEKEQTIADEGNPQKGQDWFAQRLTGAPRSETGR